jgi:hypothetical protein
MKIGEYEQMMAYLTRPGFKDGTEKIVEPPKSMQMDTTTSNPIPEYDINDFKNDAETFVLAYHNNTLPRADIADKLNAFAKKGVDAGTFSMQDAGVMVRRLIGEVKDRAQKQRLRDVVPEGIGRKEFKYGSVPGEGNSKIDYDPETKIYRKRVQETVDGKKTNKYIYSEPGQSLEDFKKIKPVRSTGADDATVRARQFIDNWTKNWFDNNLKNYGVRDFDVMINDLSKDWSEILESGDAPKGSARFKLSTPQLGLPNVTSGRDVTTKKGSIKPFNYNDVTFYANLEGSEKELSKTLSQYKKVFYKNKIETNPQLRSELNNFFEFMSRDKRGLYKKLDGKTIKDFMNTVNDDVKFLLNDEASGLGKASKNEVFNAYDDLADNYNKFTQDKARLKAVQNVTEAKIKAGPETSGQTDELIKQIRDQNKQVAKMSPEELAKNKNFIKSLRLVINPQTGQVSFSGYTENDPKVRTKGVKSDLELAKHAIERAKDPAKKGGLFSYDHISKKSFGKMNTQFPNNIQSANYITNAQLENARRFLEIPENRNTPAAQNLDKVLEDLNLTIRGKKEYGGTYGNKSNIVFDSKTNRSNIVDSQLFKNVDKLKTSGMSLGAAGDIPMAKEILSKDLEKLKTIFGSKAAKQIAQTTLRGAGAVYPFETLLTGDMQQRGLSPKEMALDIGTVGLGTIFKDIKEKFDYVKSKGLGDELQSAFRKQTIDQQARPVLGGAEGMFQEQTLTPDEQAALRAYNLDAQNIIDMRRSNQADEYRKTDEAFGFDDPMIRTGAMGGGIMRLNFSVGGLASLFKKAAQVSDALRRVKNATFEMFNNVRMFGDQKGIEKNLEGFTNIPDKNRKLSSLEDIQTLKENVPEKYHQDLDIMKRSIEQNNFETAFKQYEKFEKDLDPSLKFENIPQEYFPMVDPLNDAFIIKGPRDSFKTGRYQIKTSMELDEAGKPTGKYQTEKYDTFDPETGKFREEPELVGASTDKGKEGLN